MFTYIVNTRLIGREKLGQITKWPIKSLAIGRFIATLIVGVRSGDTTHITGVMLDVRFKRLCALDHKDSIACAIGLLSLKNGKYTIRDNIYHILYIV